MKVKLFTALSKAENNEGELQGIWYPNGRIEIGIDVWRNLSTYDYASHKVWKYDSVNEAKKYYKFTKPRKQKVLYLKDVEGKEKENWISESMKT